MQFRSTKSNLPPVSYKEAVFHCLPEDGGLYVPDQMTDIRQFIKYMNEKTDFNDMVASITPALLEGELNQESASRIACSAFNFKPELIRLDENFSILNLYNGPTGIFKDFGIAFLSAMLEEFMKEGQQAMILCAARADTAVSMAHAFSGRKGIILVLLYPSGQIRGLDTSSFAPNGGNIIPIQIKGTFDDCQRLIIETINDREFSRRHNVTSANTINAGRLLPQIFYYLYAFIQIKNNLSGDLLYSVPCGNFGNLIAGLYAWKFGMPVNGFIAAMNINNSFGDYILGKPFVPKPLVSTNSQALDVSVPLNYERLASFYEEAPAVMRNMVFPASINDGLTMQTQDAVYSKYKIHIDSNTAVAFAAAQKIITERKWNCHAHTIVLATGHPARDENLTGKTAEKSINIPKSILALKKKCEPVAIIEPQLEALESAIASCF
ncbi:MAG: threonine synthase [Treponema sp.]|nr:threonine synthase [Treponema sp.]